MMRIEPAVQNKQRGMAAFAVTTALVMVISLIVMGYSLVTRRAQQQTLDRQLGQQATIAAESGVNMAAAVINHRLAQGVALEDLPQKLTCDPTVDYPDLRLDDDNVKVTCLIVKGSTKAPEYSGITEGSPTVIPLSTSTPLTEITLRWRNTDGSPGASGCSTAAGYARPAVDAWNCTFGIMRVDIALLSNGNEDTYANTAFFYPTNLGSTPSYPLSTLSGGWHNASCQSGSCSVTITGFSGSPVGAGGRPYVMAARSLYKDSSMSINGAYGSESATFTGQAVVDSTARAGDVVKRVQVRVPLEGAMTGNAPGYGIESAGSLCKRYTAAPGQYTGHYESWTASCSRNP